MPLWSQESERPCILVLVVSNLPRKRAAMYHVYWSWGYRFCLCFYDLSIEYKNKRPEQDSCVGKKRGVILGSYDNTIWLIIKIHVLFCYYTSPWYSWNIAENGVKHQNQSINQSINLLLHKRQILTKLFGENMFCLKAYQLSIVLPSKFILLEFILVIRRPVFPWCYVLLFQNYLLLVNCTTRCNDFIRSFFIIIFDLFLKL